MPYDNFFKDFYRQHKACQKRRAALIQIIKTVSITLTIGVITIWLI
jgi:DNA topoisomerase IB